MTKNTEIDIDYKKIKALHKKLHPEFTGHTIHTSFGLTEEILDQIDLLDSKKDATVAVLYNVEFVIALIGYKDVDPTNITFFGDCLVKKTIVEGLGCTYRDAMALLEK